MSRVGIMAPIAQSVEHNMSVDNPRPPPEQTPGNRVKNLEGRRAESTKQTNVVLCGKQLPGPPSGASPVLLCLSATTPFVPTSSGSR